MGYYLVSDVHACELAHGAVFLDLRTVRYLAVEPRFLPLLRARVVGWPKSPTAGSVAIESPEEQVDFLNALLARGLIATSPCARTLPPAEIEPASEAQHPDWDLRSRTASRARSALAIAHCIATVGFALRRGGLKTLLLHLHQTRAALSTRGTLDASCLAARLTEFSRLRVWFYTARDRCLFDSLVLASYLLRERIDARLILGVGLRPFSAHAWTQVSRVVLDDSVEHVREYAPILIV